MKIDYSKLKDKVKFWKSVIENSKDFIGTTPPAIFIGRAFYPKVYTGVLAPPVHSDNAEVLDSPEIWYKEKLNIDQILDYRGQMIYSRFKVLVKDQKGRFVDIIKELAISKKPVDIEISLKKNPKFRFFLSHWVQPVGSPAPLEKVRIAENVKVERKIEYIVSDQNVKAEDAINELYESNIAITTIQKIFSAGLLGLPQQRKLVPTRWSITAVDDIVGRKLREKIKDFEEIEELRVFHNEYLGNHYEILLIPGKYSYELVEIWNINGNTSIDSDYEPYWGRKDYANSTHGAFYAGRVAILEYLERIKRQASVLLVREIRKEYLVPVGIWQLRETVRDAFNKNYEKFEILEDALKVISRRLLIKDSWIIKSKMLKILKEQSKIKKFI